MLELTKEQEKNLIRYFRRYINKYSYILHDFEVSINKDNIIINFVSICTKKIFNFNVYNTYKKLKYCLYECARDFINEHKKMLYTL